MFLVGWAFLGIAEMLLWYWILEVFFSWEAEQMVTNRGDLTMQGVPQDQHDAVIAAQLAGIDLTAILRALADLDWNKVGPLLSLTVEFFKASKFDASSIFAFALQVYALLKA